MRRRKGGSAYSRTTSPRPTEKRRESGEEEAINEGSEAADEKTGEDGCKTIEEEARKAARKAGRKAAREEAPTTAGEDACPQSAGSHVT